MRTTSYSELRRNLAAMLDSVTEDHAPVLITRERGKPAAVLMSLEDFASYEETRYLLRNPRNADRLMEAVTDLDAGKGAERELGAFSSEADTGSREENASKQDSRTIAVSKRERKAL
ncbi:type II toxin-antitoxin system Phd/YefM family antitoxin [Xanthobacter autotrophicus]|uniref:type II toxin-antitoxin system Phd/YefM family antitoxin n=1 Tax=Xanthobacter autotrophicus TaxID=280 RepID=UPI00372CB5B9